MQTQRLLVPWLLRATHSNINRHELQNLHYLKLWTCGEIGSMGFKPCPKGCLGPRPRIFRHFQSCWCNGPEPARADPRAWPQAACCLGKQLVVREAFAHPLELHLRATPQVKREVSSHHLELCLHATPQQLKDITDAESHGCRHHLYGHHRTCPHRERRPGR